MNAERTFWIPATAPEQLQIALSVPGGPPKSAREHWDRLEFHLIRLAEELEESNDRQLLFETVYSLVPDYSIALLPANCPIADLMYAVMQSDLVSGARLLDEADFGPGLDDSELQESAGECGLEDRLGAMVNGA
jgi:hypothetical protein